MTNDLTGKLIADKYRVGDLIREGDAGDLYLGRHEFMDKAVTIKVLPLALSVDGRWSKRFLDEAKNASTVSHANILNVTDFGTDSKGVVYTVYEPADGETLRAAIEKEGSLDIDRTLDIAKQAAAGIAAAHAKNVIHGGLTPEDIFLVGKEGEDRSVKVYGFGADPMSVPRGADPRYLSPEQCTDFPVADQRSDIYSLGVIIYEMLAGVAPFEGKTIVEVKQKREAEPPPPLSAFRRDLPTDLEPMILSALAGDPERRYPTMAVFAEDLQLLSGGVAAPVTAAAAAAATPKKNIWQTAFIVLAGISVLAVGLIYLTTVKKTDPTTNLQADAGSLPVQPIGPATGAQEESLAKLPEMTDAEITAAASGTMEQPPGTLPGGDGYNAWSNGGAPPIGAPPAQYIPPGQTVTLDPNGGSQFMPSDIPPGCTMLPSGLVLCPKAIGDNPAKPTPTPKTPAGNTAVQPTPLPNATPKPLATPPAKNKPGTNAPGKDKPAPGTKPAASGKPKPAEEMNR